MAAGDHIKEIGPHAHEWVTVHTDDAQNSYQECSLCCARRVKHSSGVPRQDWLDGGEWETLEKAQEQAPEPGSDEAVVAEVKRASLAEEAATGSGIPIGAGTPTQLVKTQAEKKAEEDQDGNDDEPSDSQVRRMSKPEMIEYADEIGVDRSDDPTRSDLAERIIAQRSQR